MAIAEERGDEDTVCCYWESCRRGSCRFEEVEIVQDQAREPGWVDDYRAGGGTEEFVGYGRRLEGGPGGEGEITEMKGGKCVVELA